jgi:hypothetical protein
LSSDESGYLIDSGYVIDDSLPAGPNVLWTSEKTGGGVELVIPARVNNVAKIDAVGQYQDSGYIIDDTLPASNNVLWSSNKAGSIAGKANLSVPAVAGNLARIDATGQYVDATVICDDAAVPSINVLYSSAKTGTLLSEKADLSVPAAAGNLASIDALGQFSDSSYKVDDAVAPSVSVLYSSDKASSLLSEKADLSVPAAAGNLASIDALGQFSDSSYKVDDAVAPSVSVLYSSTKASTLLSEKADLSVPAAAGNLASIDALGQFIDSSYKVDDAVAPSVSVLYSSTKASSLLSEKADLSVPAAPGNLASIDALGQFSDSSYKVDDAVAPSVSVLYSSAKSSTLLSGKADLSVPSVVGNLAKLNAIGQYVDANVIYNDLAPPASGVLYSSAKTGTLLNAKADLALPDVSGNLARIDATGQYLDAGIICNDLAPPAVDVIYTSAKASALLSEKADLSVPAAAGNLASIDALGQFGDSSFKVDDTVAPSVSVLYSSTKASTLLSEKADLSVPAAAGNLASIDALGQFGDSSFKVDDAVAPSVSVLYSSTKASTLLSEKADLSVPAAAGNLASIDALGQFGDSSFKVDDAVAPSASVLYSSDKASTLLSEKADLSVPAAAGNLASIDALGQFGDSSFKVDDAVAPSASVLYSSDKASTLLSAKADLSVPAAAGNLASIDALGQFGDSSFKVDDAVAPSASVLYSSDKASTLLSAKADLSVPAAAGNLASIDALGQFGDSSFKVDDAVAPSVSVLYSSDKASTLLSAKADLSVPAAAGNLASIDALGQFGDSSFKVDDAVAPSVSVLYSSDKASTLLSAKADLSVPAAAGNLASIDALGQFGDSSFKVDDAVAPSVSVLYSSDKASTLLSAKADLSVPFAAGNLASIDALGQFEDSSFKVDDTVSPSASVLYSSDKASTLLSAKADLSVPAAAGNLASIDALGQFSDSSFKVDDAVAPSVSVLYSSDKASTLLSGKADLSVPAAAGNLASIDALGQFEDSLFKVDDAVAPSVSVLYSSDKANTLLSGKADLSVPAAAGNLASIDALGQFEDSLFKVDDAVAPSVSVLYSSDKASTLLSAKADLSVPAAAGNLASIDALGQFSDSSFKVDDAVAPSVSVLYSSDKASTLLSGKADLSVPAAAGNLASIDALGQFEDSLFKVDDAVAPSVSVLYSSDKANTLLSAKADLSVPAAAGNLASIDALGQFEDSSFKVNDAVAPSVSVLYSSDKASTLLSAKADLSVPAAAGNLASIDALGQFSDSSFKVDDAVAPSVSVLYSSDKASTLLSAKADLSVPAAAGNLASIDALGQFSDSSFKVDDASAPSVSVLYSSDKASTLLSAKADLSVPAAAGNLASIDALGQFEDSSFKVNDTVAPSSAVLYSSAKASTLLSGKADLSAPAAAGNLASIDALGQFNDSSFKVDDTEVHSATVLYSSLKLSHTFYKGHVQYVWNGSVAFTAEVPLQIFSTTFSGATSKSVVSHTGSATFGTTDIPASSIIKFLPFTDVSKLNYTKITVVIRIQAPTDTAIHDCTVTLLQSDLSTFIEKGVIAKINTAPDYFNRSTHISTFLYGNSDPMITNGLALSLIFDVNTTLTSFTLRFYFE